MNKELQAARRLARGAGSILLEHYSGQPSVYWKGRNDPVTTADRAASEFLSGELKRLFPEDGILSEEEQDDPARITRSRVWILDPMDGTKEFISHNDEFAVMIGLAIDGVASLGVIYQPTSGKLYYAASDVGAFLEEGPSTVPLRVSPESTLSRMTIAISRSHHSPQVVAIQQRLGVSGAIRSGSLGLKVGLICEGRAHLYLHMGGRTSQWDTCAPDAILREAGGRMTDIFNAPFRYNDPEVANLHGVIASSGAIHDRIVEAVQSELRGAS